MLGLVLLVSFFALGEAGKVVLNNKAPPPPPPPPQPYDPKCPTGDCKEHKPDDHGPPPDLGACCFGQTCLAAGVPEHRCRGVWAGPDTACEDCERLRPCCNPLTGECTNEFCSDCFHNGGTPVEYCEQCEKAPTPSPQPTPKTKPPMPHPTPSHMPPPPPGTKPGPPDGACCVPDGTCSHLTQAECHACHGVFRGDYTLCGDDTCKRQCCEGTLTCTIVDKPDDCAGHLGPFGTECPDDPDTCGVSCCLKEKCTVAKSRAECVACDGRPFPGNECDTVECGGACCVGSRCSFVENRDACVPDDTDVVPIIGYKAGRSCDEPGICGGACCTSDFCLENQADACAEQSGVFQGNGTRCNLEETIEETTPSRKRQASVQPAICLNDGACCVQGQCVPTADSITCFKNGGVWQGEGSSCDDDDVKCGAGACCDGKGCFLANNDRECHFKGGKFRGQGTTCDLPAICDPEGGACCCEDKCIDMASEKQCRAYGGRSWQGVGSSCFDEGTCEEPADGTGSCCIQKSYIADGALCLADVTEGECAFRGGTFNGAGSQCGSQGDGTFQCKVVRGACCVPGDEKCYDNLSVTECRECGGHFAGEGVSCSDDYVCDPHHTGACCKAGWPCKETTHVMCLREGGRFQGFETTCNDDDGQICAVCLPCEVDRPNEADCAHDADCPTGTICLKQYGTCAVPAHRIPTEFGKPKGWKPKGDWKPPHEDPWWKTTEGVRFQAAKDGKPPLTCPLDADKNCQTNGRCSSEEDNICTRFTANGRETCSTTQTQCVTTNGDDPCECDVPYCFVPPTGAADCVPGTAPPVPEEDDDNDVPHDPWPDMPRNLGPLSCGSNDTLGYPCVAHPRKGKCGIGICMPPPDGHTLSDGCVSMCRELREYPCGCECEDAWLKSCASVAGHIYDDANNNGEHGDGEGGVVGALVKLYEKHEPEGYKFVSEEVTKQGGHYAFGGIPAGHYKVSVQLPEGLAFGGDGKAHRKVTVECLEDLDGDGKLRKRGIESAFAQKTQVTLQRKFKDNHIEEDVDFFVVPGTGSESDDDDQTDTSETDSDADGDDDDDATSPSSGGLSGAAIGGIVIGVLLLIVIVVVVLALVLGRSPRRRSRRSRSRR